MKLSDPDLERQLRASVDRYDKLPAWVREASAKSIAKKSSQCNEETAKFDEREGVEEPALD